ncbi:sulfur carrier protein ThiS [Candidatus Phycosocius spiralis]|uniref:Thiamine biosynthesis protein ThiS n=1 Tax=Candidatus Phycosocius spiralis TaxID=2815099 RepID=A0ABQ4PWB1_9PROT|nr:sulfur carrier protein ThiS [Candidatus Phycosocius spiralis]GIU67270.1 thiamine biosynthesis protein ThiS [Candidatus Phycosocius spiralis]
MKIFFNGEEMHVEDGVTLTDLVAGLIVDTRGVAIERNLAIVMKSKWDQTILADGDRLECVQFVGGGF